MDVIEALQTRRTIRKFSEESIDRESIVKMIDCARVSPSAGNMQSIKYLIIDSVEERKAIFPYIKYAGYVSNWKPKFADSPAAFIVVLNDTSIRQTNATTECDCGIAMMAISLSAFEMDIGSCILGAIEREQIRNILNINNKYEIMYLIGLGIPRQINTMFDCNDSVKYTLDANEMFKVPKRKLYSIIVKR